MFYFTFISYLIHTFPFILTHSGQHSTHIPQVDFRLKQQRKEYSEISFNLQIM